jgi:periplasmic mercuric ion binding protein
MNGKPMNKLFVLTLISFGLSASSSALAAERTVTLLVKNMDCAACPHTVKASLQAVPGVANVAVSKEKTAVVIYDDSKADLKALTAAATNAGYPSVPKS